MKKNENKLTMRELAFLSLASIQTLDKNGDIKDTKWNRFVLRCSEKVAGGKDKFDRYSASVMNKLLLNAKIREKMDSE